MKNQVVIWKKLLAVLVIVGGGLALNGCSTDESVLSGSDAGIETRAIMPDFHWVCPEEGCGFPLNGSWQSRCSACGKEYNEPHGLLIVTFASTIERYVRFDNGAGLIPNDELVQGKVVLPDGLFAEFAPQPWYDTPKAQKYFKPLTETLYYSSDNAYRLGINTGWYRTTRILYPDYSNKIKIERELTFWLVGAGKNLKGSFGNGLKEGTKAAVEAFCSR